MNIKKVGKRGILFSFMELKKSSYDCVTNVYVINGKENFFICDTYLGPHYMKKIKKYLGTKYGKKNYIIFNSHSHWDHIWGNSEFENSMIVSHKLCRKYIYKYGKEELTTHAEQFAKENINIVVPNITFENKIIFNDEGVEFFYSPGHSEDSASCYDLHENTLFVGDNVDDPIPSYICWNDLDKYKDTLEKYLDRRANRIVQCHGDVIDNKIIRSNIGYLEKLKTNKIIEFKRKDVLKKHLYNVEYLKMK